jgi:small subunit ribosomal protein S8
MSVSDPISDMLTRVRNAQSAVKEWVEMPHSRMKGEIARILKQEGFIRDFTVEGQGAKRTMKVFLKYGPDMESGIAGLRRFSRPGLRRYHGATNLPRVLGGLGIAIVSTSAGIMTDRQARQAKVGGEVLCTVW